MSRPTKQLDRRFRHVGRIKRSWGTGHAPTIKAMEQMMSGLFERGRLDILRGIQSGQYSPLQVWDAYRTNDLERLPTAATIAPLKESFTKWAFSKECSDAHRRSLMQSMRHLLGGAPNSTPVSSLATLVSTLREKMQGKHPRSFNLARAAAQAFAKTTAGRNSKLWQDITAVEVLKATAQRTKHPATAKELDALSKKVSDFAYEIMWGMACTGMGPSEYWGEWELRPGRVLIHGTKRAGRERFVPLFYAPQEPLIQYAAFRRQLANHTAIKPYDLRRTYANWLEAAGIPRTRRKLYLGHGARDVTDLYEWQQVEEFLEEDAQRLREYVFGATGKQWLKIVGRA